MEARTILETQRLTLREYVLSDAPFIIELMNSPGWLQFIGDRNVHTIEEAEAYLRDRIMKSYPEHGFGFWMVQLKGSGTPVGMCGFVKRDYLAHVDIGFALLPEYEGKGIGFEMAQASLAYARNTLKINTVLAITDPANSASISLLQKIGLRFVSTHQIPDDITLLVFSTPENVADQTAIDALTQQFYGLFTNTDGKNPNLELIYELCIPETVITQNNSIVPNVNSLSQFITPRKIILTDGTLTDFSEWELSHTTEIFGNIAQRMSLYHKQGIRSGAPFEGKGMKSFQFIRMPEGWKISAVSWCDVV